MEGSPSGMDWEADTSPKVIYQAPGSFHKRPFVEYAEDESVEYSRPSSYHLEVPQSSYPLTANASSSSGHFRQYGTTEPERPKEAGPWSYVLRTCSTVTNMFVKIATHPVNRASWSTVYGAVRYITSRYKCTDTARIAIEQVANGSKRRLIEFIDREVVPLSQQDNATQRYRERISSCRNHERNYPRSQQSSSNGMQGHTSPEEGYYMSGALMDPELDAPSTPRRAQQMPGSWIESPVADPSQHYNYTQPDFNIEMATPEAEIDILSNSPASPIRSSGPSNVWPYFGNDFNRVELTSVDEGDSLMTSEDSSDQGSSSASILFSEKESDTSSLGSEDHEMCDNDQTDLRQLSQRYSSYNTSPDAIQRAAVDEFNDIVEEQTILSEDDVDQDSPVTPSNIANATAHDASTSTPDSVQTSQPAATFVPEASSLDNAKPDPRQEPSREESPIPYQGSPIPVSTASSPRLLPQPLAIAKEETPKRRVKFYVSPKTGQPVDKVKKYIKGECMDVSYISTSTNEDFSIHSDLSASGQLHSSPTYPEQLEKQYITDRKDWEMYMSLAPDIAPEEPRIPVSLRPRALTQVKNGRARQRHITSALLVAADGSPMRSSDSEPGELATSSVDGTLGFAKNAFSGKENDDPSSQVDASIDSSIIISNHSHVSTSPLTSSGVATPTLATGSLAAGTDGSSHNEHFPSNQATPIATSNSRSEGTLANGKGISLAKDYSPSNQIDASDAPATPSPASGHGTTAHATNSSPNNASPSNQLVSSDSHSPHPSELSLNSENGTTKETPVNGKDATYPVNGTVSPSTQVETLEVPTTHDPTLAEGTLVHGKDSTPPKNGSSLSNQVDASAKPLTPTQVARDLDKLTVSGRRTSQRHATKARKDTERRAAEKARIAAEQARKEKEIADEKARKEEESKRSGVRRFPVENIIRPLSQEWEAKVDQTMAERSMAKVITKSASLSTEITRRDVGKILPQPGVSGEDARGWLNDTVIGAYLEAVVENALRVSGHKRNEIPRMVALTTYFYNKLATQGATSTASWLKRKKIDGKKMKDIERIFIPVNSGRVHWTLLVISPKFKLIEYFDSMHGGSSEIVRHAKALMRDNLKDDFVEDEWRVVGTGGPTQTNGSDCGVFVSTTAKMISLGIDPLAYSDVDIPTQRRRMVAELINRGFEGDLAPDVVFADD